ARAPILPLISGFRLGALTMKRDGGHDESLSETQRRLGANLESEATMGRTEAQFSGDLNAEDPSANRRRGAWRTFVDSILGLRERRAKTADGLPGFPRGPRVRVPTPPRLPQLTLGAAVPLPIDDDRLAEACGTVRAGKN